MDILTDFSCQQFTDIVVNLTNTAVLVYKVKELYLKVKSSLNELWDNILDINNFLENNNYQGISELENKDLCIAYTKNLLARKDYDSDELMQKICEFYGINAFEKLSRVIYLLGEC